MGGWTTNAARGARRTWTRSCSSAMGTTAGGDYTSTRVPHACPACIARMRTSTLAQVDGAECAVRCGRRRWWRLCLWCERRFVCSPCLCRRVSCYAGATHPNCHRHRVSPRQFLGEDDLCRTFPSGPLKCCRRHAARRGWVAANGRGGEISLALDERALLLLVPLLLLLCCARGARCQTERASLIFSRGAALLYVLRSALLCGYICMKCDVGPSVPPCCFRRGQSLVSFA